MIFFILYNVFILTFYFLDINIATSIFFLLTFSWYIFFHIFYF